MCDAPADREGRRGSTTMSDFLTCDNCGMSYLDPSLPPEELLPGMWTNPKPHVCPEPFAPDQARYMRDVLVATGMPTTQTIKARIKLGLEHA